MLDLFCGAGGASAGYHAAGFDVTGVDISPSDHYPYRMIRGDALEVPIDGYDLVAASPPCQRYSQATPIDRRADHPDLVAVVRARLADAVARGSIGAYVIENVPGAPLVDPVTVCGWTLRLPVRRHRIFESSVPIVGTGCCHDATGYAVPVYGTSGQRDTAGRTVAASEAREAMGISWAPWSALTQAVPPAFTLWVGTQVVSHLRARRDGRDQAAYVTYGSTDISHMSNISDVSDLSDARTPATDTSDARAAVGQSAQSTRLTCRRTGCGVSLERPVTGRWPRYCSHACRQAGYRERLARKGL